MHFRNEDIIAHRRSENALTYMINIQMTQVLGIYEVL